MLIGPGMPFEPPPPFDEFFEPIALSRLGFHEDAGLRTLSGDAPTRQERQSRVILWVLAIPALVSLVAAAYAIFFLAPPSARLVVGGAFALVGGIIAGVLWLGRHSGRWYLIPGGVAIVRSSGGARSRLRVVTRADAAAILRYVSTGKTTVLMLTLLQPDCKPLAASLSDRQAIAFLAGWQSCRPPPTRAQLFTLLVAGGRQ